MATQTTVRFKLLYDRARLREVDLGEQDPAVGSAFNNNCGANSSGNPGCLVGNCSCTGLEAGYWSSTTLRGNSVFTLSVFFNLGFAGYAHESFETDYVRAVRGGL